MENNKHIQADYSNLLTLIKALAPITSEEEKLITSKFKPLLLKKGAYFLEEGKVNKLVGFLNKGLVRYFVTKNDQEATFEFTNAGEFVADYHSFNNSTPSLQNIQAIEPCEMLVINYPDLQLIFNSTTYGNYLGRIIMEHRFDVMVQQLMAIYMQNQEERYHYFIKQYADIAQRIPQYLIASYVGIQPQSLSRIRKKLALKH